MSILDEEQKQELVPVDAGNSDNISYEDFKLLISCLIPLVENVVEAVEDEKVYEEK